MPTHYKWQMNWAPHPQGLEHVPTHLIAPPGAATLLATPEQRLVLAVHHGAHNLPAMLGCLRREAQALYAAQREGRPARLKQP